MASGEPWLGTGRAARGSLHVAAAEKKQKLMWEALREAVDEEMEADPTVCLMGAGPQRSGFQGSQTTARLWCSAVLSLWFAMNCDTVTV